MKTCGLVLLAFWSSFSLVEGTCHHGYTKLKTGCYLVTNRVELWQDGKNFCAAKHGHLLALETAEETQVLSNYLSNTGYTENRIHLNLRRKNGHQDVYVWNHSDKEVQGSAITWGGSNPGRQSGEDCIFTTMDTMLNEWRDCYCDVDVWATICETEATLTLSEDESCFETNPSAIILLDGRNDTCLEVEQLTLKRPTFAFNIETRKHLNQAVIEVIATKCQEPHLSVSVRGSSTFTQCDLAMISGNDCNFLCPFYGYRKTLIISAGTLYNNNVTLCEVAMLSM